MADKFDTWADSPEKPARKCFPITPHASNEIDPLPKAIRAPSDGVITLRAVDSDADVAHPVFAGERLDIRVKHVRIAGTTVTGTIMGYA